MAVCMVILPGQQWIWEGGVCQLGPLSCIWMVICIITFVIAMNPHVWECKNVGWTLLRQSKQCSYPNSDRNKNSVLERVSYSRYLNFKVSVKLLNMSRQAEFNIHDETWCNLKLRKAKSLKYINTKRTGTKTPGGCSKVQISADNVFHSKSLSFWPVTHNSYEGWLFWRLNETICDMVWKWKPVIRKHTPKICRKMKKSFICLFSVSCFARVRRC